jgi:hypothetical protein
VSAEVQELLSQGEKALEANDFSRVHELTRSIEGMLPGLSPEERLKVTASLHVRAYCATGNLQKVKTRLMHLSSKERGRAASFCRKYDFELPTP